MMNTNKKNGFTLIDFIMVMFILGIMAAVAVPRYLDSISNAEEAAEDALRMYDESRKDERYQFFIEQKNKIIEYTSILSHVSNDLAALIYHSRH